MNIKPITTWALAALMLSGAVVFDVHPVVAQQGSVPATATRPAKTPQGQTSIPSAAPPATATQTTGEVPRDPMIKKMNEDEKKKVETEGK
ncbi:hypothetical protein [Bradyrhizobium jicamae]|uniref:hypothetical protein n=1 Tax=Bradyrhizobium jicamae TaxID=280332 RepID=UPI001BA6F4FA|nr:hypothetical protein [Bradyrhizobium jicamae]MBR0939442.1 hypothetical protein [Bradyrhizobium jicamae]